jgi:microcystin degradation protein MlrC
MMWSHGARADDTLQRLVPRAAEATRWRSEVLDAPEAVAKAMARALRSPKPVVLADTQDNPGAGGNGDTTGLLKALLRNNAQEAVLGLLVDGAWAPPCRWPSAAPCPRSPARRAIRRCGASSRCAR